MFVMHKYSGIRLGKKILKLSAEAKKKKRCSRKKGAMIRDKIIKEKQTIPSLLLIG